MKQTSIITVCLLSFLSGMLWIVGCKVVEKKPVVKILAPPAVPSAPVQRENIVMLSVIIPPAEPKMSPPLRLPNVVAKDYAWGIHKYPSGEFVKWCDGDSFITNSGLIYLRGVLMKEWVKTL